MMGKFSIKEDYLMIISGALIMFPLIFGWNNINTMRLGFIVLFLIDILAIAVIIRLRK